MGLDHGNGQSGAVHGIAATSVVEKLVGHYHHCIRFTGHSLYVGVRWRHREPCR